MKKVIVVASLITVGYLLGIASFHNGYERPLYNLEWRWSLKDKSKDCLMLWERTSEHSAIGYDLACFKNKYPTKNTN